MIDHQGFLAFSGVKTTVGLNGSNAMQLKYALRFDIGSIKLQRKQHYAYHKKLHTHYTAIAAALMRPTDTLIANKNIAEATFFFNS